MKQATLSPDDAAAHMYPSDLKKFEFGEHAAEAFSIAVGCPDETSVPLFTTTQAEAYAAASVREALMDAYHELVDLHQSLMNNSAPASTPPAQVANLAMNRIAALIPE